MRAARLFLLAPLALAACHARDRDAAGNNATDNAADVVVPPSETDVPEAPEENGTDDAGGNGAVTPVGNVAAANPARSAIPAAFHGRWGLVAGDCGPDMSIAKGLMTVNGEMLRFYESVGKPAVVTWPTPTRMEGRFAFSGEGTTWSKDMTLAIEGNGRTLVRTERGPAATYRYTRCKT